MLAEKNKKQVPKIIIGLALVVGLGLIAKHYVFDNNFLYAGTLEATKVDLSAQLNSSIEKVNVQEGDRVAVDQELVVLSCEDYKATADLAKNSFERNERLYKQGVVSQDALDRVSNIKQEADIRIDWCIIESPIVGTVLSRYHEPGEVVSPGTKILTLANIRDIWAYIYVPQTELAKIKVGMQVKGFLPELNNQEFIGKVIKINSEAEFTPKNVQTRSERTRLIYGVKVSFLGANEDETLKPGMTIEIELPKA